MTRLQDIAELLVASWVVGRGEKDITVRLALLRAPRMREPWSSRSS